MPRAVAINVGANSSLPGFRGPIYPDGSFVYAPIPEREPVAETVPTYADLDLPIDVPAEHRDAAVHLDPEFAEYAECERYTYGDEHGVKAAPLLELAAGDVVAFYATLETVEHGAGGATPPRGGEVLACDDASGPTGDHVSDSTGDDATAADAPETAPAPPDWRPPTWGAYVIGAFLLARDPIAGDEYEALPAAERERLANNAHVRRETVDAEVFLVGEPERSGLLDAAVPLSLPGGGADANALVTEHSADSGKGPWWRRPLRFDAAATGALLAAIGEPVAPAVRDEEPRVD